MIPQICPNCENHISQPHAKDCCFGTNEYAHLGWPNSNSNALSTNIGYVPNVNSIGTGAITAGHTHTISYPCSPTPTITTQRIHSENSTGILTMGEDTASAIRRLLDYLNDEPEGLPCEPANPNVSGQEVSDKGKFLCLLSAKCEELRKEAAGISLVESRAKRTFAIGILEGLIEELNAA